MIKIHGILTGGMNGTRFEAFWLEMPLGVDASLT